MDKTHNGWKNYPTWATYSWITNELELHTRITVLLQDWQTGHDSFEWDEPATLLKAYVDMLCIPETEATDNFGLGADLIRFSLDQIDWDRLVERLSE